MKGHPISELTALLKNGDLCVAKVDKSQYHTGYVLCYFKNGFLYDAYTLEDPSMFSEEDYIDDYVERFFFLDVNVFADITKFN